jgi:antirestriction protein
MNTPSNNSEMPVSDEDIDLDIDENDGTTDENGTVLEGDEETLFLGYCEAIGIEPMQATLEEAQDAYQGNHESSADFAESVARETAGNELDALPVWISSSINWKDAWRDLRFDYSYAENPSTGMLMFFRLC